MQDEYTLTEEEQEEIRGYTEPIRDLQKQMTVSLRMVIRQQHLVGDFILSAEGTKLIRPVAANGA